MKTYSINGKKGKVTISIPTIFDEITPEYLFEVSKEVETAPHWSLIALISKCTLNRLLTSARKRVDTEMKTVSVFIKTFADDKDSEFIKSLTPGTILVCNPSELSMGSHVNCKHNDLSISKILSFMEGDVDITKESLRHQVEHYFVSFKLVPNSVIHGAITEAASEPIDTKFRHILDNSLGGGLAN